MAMKEKQGMESKGTVSNLNRFARVLAEAKGEAPRALMRMPDKALEETEKRKRLIKKLQGLDINKKREMAEDPNTDKDMLDILGLEKDLDIKYLVACNRNTSVETLDRLSRDENPWFRAAVAENENDSLEIFERLSRDKDWRVREAMALNGKTPIEILKRLEKDANEDVRNSATVTLKKLQENLEK